MHSKKYQEMERVFNTLAKEHESAFKLLSQLNHLLDLLWDHYESSFLDKLRERNLPPSAPDPTELPF